MRRVSAGGEVEVVEEVAALEAVDQLVLRGRSGGEQGRKEERSNAPDKGRGRHPGGQKQSKERRTTKQGAKERQKKRGTIIEMASVQKKECSGRKHQSAAAAQRVKRESEWQDAWEAVCGRALCMRAPQTGAIIWSPGPWQTSFFSGTCPFWDVRTEHRDDWEMEGWGRRFLEGRQRSVAGGESTVETRPGRRALKRQASSGPVSNASAAVKHETGTMGYARGFSVPWRRADRRPVLWRRGGHIAATATCRAACGIDPDASGPSPFMISMILHDDPAGLGLLSLVRCRATFLAGRRPQRVQRRPRATARSPLHRRAVDTATGISIQRPGMPRSAHLPRAHLDPDPGALCDISIVAPVTTHPKYGSPGAARAVVAGRADPMMAGCRLADPCNFIQTFFDAPSPVSPSPAG